jgi:ribosomal protein S18 acetylase RimI-like enzyme
LGLRLQFTEPAVLESKHNIKEFHSGEESLDRWLADRALPNALSDASRTYVSCVAGSAKVAGYYSLSAAEVERSVMSAKIARNMPLTIPATLLGRLAVSVEFQRQGLAERLLLDAVEKSKQASLLVATRILLVHAINEKAADFYTHYGFSRLHESDLTMGLDLKAWK